jgi:hypothetical protein
LSPNTELPERSSPTADGFDAERAFADLRDLVDFDPLARRRMNTTA